MSRNMKYWGHLITSGTHPTPINNQPHHHDQMSNEHNMKYGTVFTSNRTIIKFQYEKVSLHKVSTFVTPDYFLAVEINC